MKLRTALVFGGICAFGGGCGQLSSVSRPASVGPDVSRHAEAIDPRQVDKLATIAFEQVRSANPRSAFTTDYGNGFRKGFADYLRGASEGEPPAVPPACYGKAEYETPDGRQAVMSWFRGYREGALQAQASGLRPTTVTQTQTAGASPVSTQQNSPL
jgi:hypothetical protein